MIYLNNTPVIGFGVPDPPSTSMSVPGKPTEAFSGFDAAVGFKIAGVVIPTVIGGLVGKYFKHPVVGVLGGLVVGALVSSWDT